MLFPPWRHLKAWPICPICGLTKTFKNYRGLKINQYWRDSQTRGSNWSKLQQFDGAAQIPNVENIPVAPEILLPLKMFPLWTSFEIPRDGMRNHITRINFRQPTGDEIPSPLTARSGEIKQHLAWSEDVRTKRETAVYLHKWPSFFSQKAYVFIDKIMCASPTSDRCWAEASRCSISVNVRF